MYYKGGIAILKKKKKAQDTFCPFLLRFESTKEAGNLVGRMAHS